MFWQESPYYEHMCARGSYTLATALAPLVLCSYSQFKANVHYVPVKRDFSDLLEKIHWCAAPRPLFASACSPLPVWACAQGQDASG